MVAIWIKLQMICKWSSWCHCYPHHLLCYQNLKSVILLVQDYPEFSGKDAIKCVCIYMYYKKSPNRGLRSSPHLDPDLVWPWKSYRREWHIDLNKYHYLVCGCIEYDCGHTFGRTYVRT